METDLSLPGCHSVVLLLGLGLRDATIHRFLIEGVGLDENEAVEAIVTAHALTDEESELKVVTRTSHLRDGATDRRA